MSQLPPFVERLIPEACSDLFAAWGVSLRPALALRNGAAIFDDPDTTCGGLIQFGGQTLAGSLLLAAPFAFIASCRPAEVRTKELLATSSSDWILVRDWSMELSNQLLGRLKNRLHAFGITLESQSPTAVSGYALTLAAKSRKSTPYSFSSGPHSVKVWFDVEIKPGIDLNNLPKDDAAGATSPKEGDTIIF